MIKKSEVITFIILLCLAVSCFVFAGTHDPWDGTKWDVTSPDIDQPHGNDYKEIYDLRKGVAIRMNKEHETLATSSAGGVHKNGAAVTYEGTVTPTNRPDGSTALADNAVDRGRIWIDDNYDPPVIKRWAGTAFEVLGRYIAGTTSNLTFLNTTAGDGESDRLTQIRARGTQSGSEESMLGHINFSHDGTGDDEKGKFRIALNDGNDGESPSLTVLEIGSDKLLTIIGGLTGGSSSDITINTNKFTVAAATGNTVIAGTLTQQGVATLADTSALATSGAPAADAQIANKKYVDDNIGSANWSPTSMAAGTVSVTSPNGMIMKWGTGSIAAQSSAQITFASAFTTGCYHVQVQQDGNESLDTFGPIGVKTITNSSFYVENDNGGATRSFTYLAIGY